MSKIVPHRKITAHINYKLYVKEKTFTCKVPREIWYSPVVTLWFLLEHIEMYHPLVVAKPKLTSLTNGLLHNPQGLLKTSLIF